ncbi:hypothetical protein CDAR_544331 [Caerostris darwini]|uniref:C2H2-type domain-containing protein n=1 Tax=Caerostris darwini TaxID=1538125 RepID=A0AAV4R6E0_9ARAC|nr:hypothetical protein CDAR_544331 [Caerostris darwini]
MRCGLSGLRKAWCQAREGERGETRLFKCKRCDHTSVTKKELRHHLLIVHKEGRLFDRTLDACGRPLNFFGDPPVEKGKKEPPKQLQTEDIEEGDSSNISKNRNTTIWSSTSVTVGMLPPKVLSSVPEGILPSRVLTSVKIEMVPSGGLPQ